MALFLSISVDFANAKELIDIGGGGQQHTCYGLTPDQLGGYLAFRCSDCIQYRADKYLAGSQSTCTK